MIVTALTEMFGLTHPMAIRGPMLPPSSPQGAN